MNKYFHFLFLLSFSLSLLACKDKPKPKPPTPPAPTTFFKGADVSWLPQMEATGYVFYDENGNPADCLDLLMARGINAVRLRVFVHPSSDKISGHCSPEETAQMAQRAKEKGLDVMIDFHYSDNQTRHLGQCIICSASRFCIRAYTIHPQLAQASGRNAKVGANWQRDSERHALAIRSYRQSAATRAADQ